MAVRHQNNYWKEFPDILILDEFEKLYINDKSKLKEESSKIMWAVWYVLHPESTFYNMPDKKLRVAKDFLKQPDFNWDKLSNILQSFKTMVLSDAEQALVSWGELIVMRDKAIKDLYKSFIESVSGDVDLKALETLDKMLANNPKLFNDYKNIKKDYEEDKITKKGKRNKSATDSGEM